MSLRFAVYDVFTDQPFAGNPLAVVFDADALSDAHMQTIAREFNLSETIFVRRPSDARHAAQVRIFTPGAELPFAGHPTIGGAIALAEDRHEPGAPNDVVLVLEEKIGPVRCGVKLGGEKANFAEFSVPKLAEVAGEAPDAETLARVLGLAPEDIGFGAHTPSCLSAGVPYIMAPLASLDALARARCVGSLRESLGCASVFAYARAAHNAPHAFRARMFAPEVGIPEDPATGSAVAAFAGVLERFEALPDGWHTLPVLQGVEMGRPSLIGLEVQIEAGKLTGARIAGQAVKISEGVLLV